MPATEQTLLIPQSLRTWFIIHFYLDIIFGLPLLFLPTITLGLFGWETVDPATTRLVGAALMGIGVESFLARNKGIETFRGMLNLKLIWSSSAVLGIILSLIDDAPSMTWMFLIIFASFFGIWFYYRLKLK